MRGNDKLRERFYGFALRVITLVRHLPKDMVAQEIGRKLLRSATSIAANYEEAAGAFSREDFIYKISIAFKEARETNLWLRLLKDTGFLMRDVEELIRESESVRNILGKSVSTAKDRKN